MKKSTGGGKRNKTKRDLYYEEAQSHYLTGMSLAEIKKMMPVSRQTLSSWKELGHWERKKELVAEHPRLISQALRGLVKQKVQALLAEDDGINLEKVEELNKIILLIDRMEERCWDERAAIIEVMSRFGDFVRRQAGEKRDLEMLRRLMEKFFQETE